MSCVIDTGQPNESARPVGFNFLIWVQREKTSGVHTSRTWWSTLCMHQLTHSWQTQLMCYYLYAKPVVWVYKIAQNAKEHYCTYQQSNCGYTRISLVTHTQRSMCLWSMAYRPMSGTIRKVLIVAFRALSCRDDLSRTEGDIAWLLLESVV
jgi:hypothetical protein